MIYGYDNLLCDIKGLNSFSIGKSLFGRNIFGIKTGSQRPKVIIVAGTHARESISSYIAMRLILDNLDENIIYISMLNPDGISLVKYGINSAPEKYKDFLLEINGSEDFSLFKANGRGVDLNTNFDADFGSGEKNIRYPHSENFIGEYPFSEPETRALKDFVLENKFNVGISLHSTGDLIYYGFNNLCNDEKYVKILSDNLSMPYFKSLGSAGGFKDWFIDKGLGFSVTIELGDDNLSHPINVEEGEGIYNKVKSLPKLLTSISEELWKKSLCSAR